MATLKLELDEFLKEVLNGNGLSMEVFFSDDYYIDYFYFDSHDFESPDEDEEERVLKVCGEKAAPYVDDIWREAMRYHYENSYIEEYTKAVQTEIEECLERSFDKLTDFFKEEIQEAGIPLVLVKPFEVEVNWEENTLLINGNLTLLELVLLEIMRASGWGYNGIEEFERAYGSNQFYRIKSHLSYLKNIESIYGTIYRFFSADLTELDYYGTMGDYDVTDEELKEAACEYC